MKKFKKLVAVLSSTIITAVIGITSVSAGIEGENYYYTTCTNSNGYVEPIRVHESVIYTGIVVTMPDNTVPTADEIGINCEISEYDAVNHGLMEYISIKDGAPGWGFEETVEPEANQYVLDIDEILNEDEAIEFAQKLVIRGIVEKAEVLYSHFVSNGTIFVFDNDNYITVNFKNDSQAADFSIEKYPEIKETLKYAEYDFKIEDSHALIYCNLENSNYIDEETNFFNSMNVYNDVTELNNIMISNYEEIENIELAFNYLYSDNPKNAVYSIEPMWGDATNDDIIDLYDAIEIAKYIMNISDMDEDSILLADINRDGVTDLYDAIEIAKTLLPQ